MSFPAVFKVNFFLTVFRITLSLYYWIASSVLFNWITSIFSILSFKRTVDPEGKGVLVTGCDSGFGHSLVKKLDKLGYHVFATVLSTESNGAKDLMKNCSNRVLTVQMNVTKKVEVDNVVDMIRRSGIPLWSVVNNAGIARSSFVEWADDVDEFEKTFAVNVFGLVRVTKACLPLLRRTKGRVINMASTCGRFSMPSLSAYCMSKFSVRAFSDALRRELKSTPFGIKIIAVEPHFYKTPITNWQTIMNITDSTWKDQTPQKIRTAYGRDKWYDNWFDRAGVCIDMISRKETHEVVDAMLAAITSTKPKLYYRCCSKIDSVVLKIVESVNEEWQDWLISLQADLIPKLMINWYGRDSFSYLKKRVKGFNEIDEFNKLDSS